MAATIAKVVVYCGTDPSSSACHQAAALGAVATILDRLGVRALAAAGDDILRFFIGTASKLAGYVVDSHGYRLFGFVDCG
jgi:hypothetical protein